MVVRQLLLWWRQRQLRSANPAKRQQALLKLAERGDPAMVPVLLAGLEDEHAMVREAAAGALGGSGDGRAVDPLLKALGDPDPGARRAATGALEQMARMSLPPPKRAVIAVALEKWDDAVALGAAAVIPLKKTLQSSDALVRAAAAGALGRISDRRVVDYLLAALPDADARVRLQAVAGLTPHAAGKAFQPLLGLLPDPDTHVRQAAAVAVGTCADERAVDPLLAALRDPVVHDIAVRGLETLTAANLAEGARARIAVALRRWDEAVALGDASLPSLVATLSEADPGVREAAVRALGRISSPLVVEPLQSSLRDLRASVRLAAVEGLARLGGRAAVEALPALLGDADAGVREAAIAGLGASRDAGAVTPLIGALRDAELRDAARRGLEALLASPIAAAARGRVAVALRRWDDAVALGADAVEPLLVAVADPDAAVRRAVVQALGRIGDGRAIEPLLRAVGDQDAAVRRAVLGALDGLRSACRTDVQRARVAVLLQQWNELASLGVAALDPVLSVLHDPDAGVRAEATRALAAIADGRAVDALVAALRDEHWEVREAAGWGLREVGDARAVEPLIEALRDEDGDVVEAAIAALRQIGEARAIEPLLALLLAKGEAAEAALAAVQTLARQSLPAPLQARVAVALGRWNDLVPLGDAAVAAVVPVLGSEDVAVREAAAKTLARLGGARAVTGLVTLLEDSDAGVRRIALAALAKFEWKPSDDRQRALAAVLHRRWDAVVDCGAVAVGPLLAALRDPDRNVRRNAAGLLARLGATEAVEALAETLADEDWRVRMAAAEALGSLGGDSALTALAVALHDPDAEVRVAVAEALRALGDPRGALVAAVEDPDCDVRRVAIEAVGRNETADRVPLLVRALADPDWGLRRAAVAALVALGWQPEDDAQRATVAVAQGRCRDAAQLGSIALTPLLAALGDEDGRLREEAATALRGMDDERAAAALAAGNTSRRQPTGQVDPADADGDSGAKGEPVLPLAATEAAEPRSFDALVKGLRDQDWSVREAAATGLGQLGDVRAAAELTIALGDEDWGVREAAAVALAALGWSGLDEAQQARAAIVLQQWDRVVSLGPAAVEPLVAALADDEADLRQAAAAALGRIRSRRAVEPLAAALRDRDRAVRVAAAAALEGIGWSALAAPTRASAAVLLRRWEVAVHLGRSAIEPLAETLRRDDGPARVAAAAALGRIGDVAAVGPLVRALGDRRSAVRQAAADALATMRHGDAVVPLAAALNDGDQEVRAAAAEALGTIGDARAIEPLAMALKDPEWEVRLAAVDALAAIGHPRAMVPLSLTAEDADDEVRGATEVALQQLGRREADTTALRT